MRKIWSASTLEVDAKDRTVQKVTYGSLTRTHSSQGLRGVGKLAEGKPRDSAEAIFYRRLLRLIICVDRMHFKVSCAHSRERPSHAS